VIGVYDLVGFIHDQLIRVLLLFSASMTLLTSLTARTAFINPNVAF
jgi:hypothetical protein